MAPEERSLDRFGEAAAALGLSPTRYPRYVELLFDGVPLAGRELLDVGAGSGLVGFYAALQGAQVTCLEPTVAGSNPAMEADFAYLLETFGDRVDVTLERRTLQELEPTARSYDVIVLHNSVNHVDEAACRALRDDPEARRTYVDLFTKLREALRPGGDLIVADCARLNLFGVMGVRSPAAPTIDWRVHQQPSLWAALLKNAGFVDVRIRWKPPSRAGRAGELLLANWLGGFLTHSHFRLTAHRGDGGALAS